MKLIFRQTSRLALCVALAFGTFACSQLTAVKAPVPQAVTIASSSVATDTLRPLQLTDVMQFREIKERKLSADQQWVIYTAEADYGESTGYVNHLGTGQQFSVANADRGLLSADGQFALFRQRSPLLAREQAKDDKEAREALAHDAVLLNTKTGTQQQFNKVDRFAFSGDGSFAVLLKQKAESKATSQLLQVVILASGEVVDLGQVTQFSVAEKGSLLAFVQSVEAKPAKKVASKTASKSDNAAAQQQVQVYDGQKAAVVALTAAAKSVYTHLVFSPDGKQLAFLGGDKASKGSESAQQLWLWAGKQASTPTLNHVGWIVSAQQEPSWSEDSQRIFLGLRPTPAAPTEKLAKPESTADLFELERLRADRTLQVWHGQDDRISPQQKAEYQQSLKRTAPAVFWVNEQRFVQLSTDVEERLYQTEHADAALISNGRAYLREMTWNGRVHDMWHVNLHTGKRQQVFTANSGSERASLSPSGRYVVYQQQTQLWLFDSETATTQPLGVNAGVSWVDEVHDRPEPASGYGVAGWLSDESAVLVYDRFDIWSLGLDGSSRNVTQTGRTEQQRFRVEQTDSKALAFAPNSQLLLRSYNEEDKHFGFYQLNLADSTLVPLLTGAKRYDLVETLEQRGQYLYTEQSFRQFPDLWLANNDFSERKQVTDINPQQAQFVWGDSHLIDWYTDAGERLQGIVLTPDGYDANKRYPVLVYYYEQYTDRLHQYNQMKVNHRPNFPFYLGQDYVVFLPDIHFREGEPGPSATESLIPAIDRLIELGVADPKAIGLHGHSWSGYQTAFVITETDRFAAAVAGAPVSNMTSAYNGIRWTSGLARQFQYEMGQSRIGVPMSDDLNVYLKNSPVFFTDRINTPLVIQFGDEDGAVPWEQGIEMYLAMRRLNKAVVMLQYEGEDHHLARYANKVDYSIKMLEFFNHFLKGAPAPDWWQQGQRYQKH